MTEEQEINPDLYEEDFDVDLNTILEEAGLEDLENLEEGLEDLESDQCHCDGMCSCGDEEG